jgi:acyl-CoA thioesterase FadM
VYRSEDRAHTASGRTVHAAVNLDGRPCRLPARVREVFA